MCLTEQENDVLVISKKLKGDDGYKVFSVRIREEIVAQLDEIARMSNRSRNELINLLLEYGIKNCRIVE